MLQTDASDVGIGAVLSQLDDQGTDHPVAYFSRKLLLREQKYSAIEKECLSIKLATQAFRVYLLGKPFVIQTDHQELEWRDRLKENNAKLSRWSIALQLFRIQVRHRLGKDNSNADSHVYFAEHGVPKKFIPNDTAMTEFTCNDLDFHSGRYEVPGER